MAKGGSLSLNTKKGKVREALRNPIDVLNSLKSKACDEGYCYERLYRNLYNEEFYLLAYQNIYAREGNMTAGADGKTIDGMGMDRIQRLIGKMKNHSYQPNPARRTYIEKKNGKKRPLGIPSFDDKLVQEVVRLILESIYEPTFSNYSHGFRPNRSCHTALQQIQSTFTGVKWFIEGDICGFFDNIDHAVLINILRKRIHDEYFIALLWKFLKAGYVEDWMFHNTYSETPQGSIISPIMSNIYLDELDRYMEIYMKEFERGKRRQKSAEYANWEYKLKYLRYEVYAKDKWVDLTAEERKTANDQIHAVRSKMLKCEYSDPQDSGYRRRFFVRYADDWLCGVIGSKQDAIATKQVIQSFLLKELHLELSEEKTLVTHGYEKAQFLGYEITIGRKGVPSRDKLGKLSDRHHGRVRLYLPKQAWLKKLIQSEPIKIEHNADGKEIWKPKTRNNLLYLPDHEIFRIYDWEIVGLYQYYRFADNASVLND